MGATGIFDDALQCLIGGSRIAVVSRQGVSHHSIRTLENMDMKCDDCLCFVSASASQSVSAEDRSPCLQLVEASRKVVLSQLYEHIG